jgi:hypothetical protein
VLAPDVLAASWTYRCGVSAPDDAAPPGAIDPTERIDLLLRDLRSALSGLSSREADRRRVQFGPNVLVRRGGRRWPRELVRQFVHPLALLLWVAAGLAWRPGSSRSQWRSWW